MRNHADLDRHKQVNALNARRAYQKRKLKQNETTKADEISIFLYALSYEVLRFIRAFLYHAVLHHHHIKILRI